MWSVHGVVFISFGLLVQKMKCSTTQVTGSYSALLSTQGRLIQMCTTRPKKQNYETQGNDGVGSAISISDGAQHLWKRMLGGC